MVVVGEVDKGKEKEEQNKDFEENPLLFEGKLKIEILSKISLPIPKL